MDARETYREQALQEIEELKVQNVNVVPITHPLMITVFKFMLSPVVTRTSRKHTYCAQCSFRVGHKWKFCANCGEPLT